MIKAQIRRSKTRKTSGFPGSPGIFCNVFSKNAIRSLYIYIRFSSNHTNMLAIKRRRVSI